MSTSTTSRHQEHTIAYAPGITSSQRLTKLERCATASSAGSAGAGTAGDTEAVDADAADADAAPAGKQPPSEAPAASRNATLNTDTEHGTTALEKQHEREMLSAQILPHPAPRSRGPDL